jgi:anti-sigma factor RsiW
VFRHVEREILSALVDGELGPDERRYVHDHLQTCADCREVSEAFGVVQGLLSDLPRIVAPESFVSDVLRAPQAGPAKAVRRAMRGPRGWVAAGAAAASIAVTLAGLVTKPPADQAPIGAFVSRHVSVSSGNSVGGQVLFAVPRR